MPSRPPTACRRTGCGGVVVGGICSRCGPLRRATAAEHDERRGDATARGYDSAWRRVRAVALARDSGLCCLCHRPAVLVDHITPIRDGGERLALDNLQSLCRRCHDAKTGEDVRKRAQAG